MNGIDLSRGRSTLYTLYAMQQNDPPTDSPKTQVHSKPERDLGHYRALRNAEATISPLHVLLGPRPLRGP